VKNRGFTLIELLMVIAVVAIVAALAVPMMRDLIENARLTTTSNSIVEAVALARSEAVKRNQIVRVTPTDGANWANGWSVILADNSSVQQFDAVPFGLAVTASEAIADIQFQANGTRVAGGNPLTLSVCTPKGKGRVVTLTATGSTKIQALDAGCV